MQSFLDTFSRYISHEDILVLAVSGGVDSMVLFDLVVKNHPREKIIVVHFDHALRGAESDGDRELVASICKKENITFEMKKMDIKNLAKEGKMSVETTARQERYRFFEEIREKYQAKYILTAHHTNDQIETILLNLTKGGKMRGLSGMPLVSGSIFRPLLFTAKDEVLLYQKEHQILYREDSSNSDTLYERNRIRHEVLPVLFALNPTIDETCSDLAIYMQGATEFLSDCVRKWLDSSAQISGQENTFFKDDFLSLTPFFQGEVISYLYTQAQGGSSHGLSRGLIDELIRFIGDKNSYGKKEIKNLRMERRGERVYY